MGKKKKIPEIAISKNQGKIPDSATNHSTKTGSTDDKQPIFSFKHVDNNRYRLSEWESREIDDLIQALKKIENHTWFQIKSQGSKQQGGSVGCGFKLISKHPKLPESISKDVLISEMRVCQKKRIFGFRVPSSPVYCLVWFDRNHSICPE